MPLTELLQLAAFAVGLSYVVTGALIGYPLRVLGFLSLRWCPLPLSTLFFCPSCNAWWMGAGLALWAGQSWQHTIQCAFTSCLLAAIVQAQWGLAADDREAIAKAFSHSEGSHGDSEEGNDE
jgi:MFS superfamily sulfate permease-like transporter